MSLLVVIFAAWIWLFTRFLSEILLNIGPYIDIKLTVDLCYLTDICDAVK